MTWEEIYREFEFELLPWYSAILDPDLKKALGRLKISSGKMLDIGSGPGTQSSALHEMGFDVTGIDVSPSAVRKAKVRYPTVNFLVRDATVWNPAKGFDYAFDRGCFHSLSERNRQKYIRNMAGIVKKRLFLKCFSDKALIDGPGKFNRKQLAEELMPYFNIISIRETAFQGRKQPYPAALFAELEPALQKVK